RVAGSIGGNDVVYHPLCVAWIALGVSMVALAVFSFFSSNVMHHNLAALSCLAFWLLAVGTLAAALWSGPLPPNISSAKRRFTMEWWLVGLGVLIILTILNTAREAASIRRDVARLDRKLNLLLKQMNIPLEAAFGPSERVKELARDPSRKIEAIKVYRE